jgi:predicted nucleotidyltransferase
MGPSADRVVAHVVSRAEACPGIARVVLFGSRARGDARPRSDYDFAIHAGGLSHADWSRWCLDTAESAPTLCAVDLVLASGPISEDLRRAIETEGVTVYERRENTQGC